MQRTISHDPRAGRNLLRVWLLSCALGIVVAVAGKLFERWSICSFHPGDADCALHLLYIKLFCYAAGFVIFVAMTLYVLVAARRSAQRSRS